MWMTAKEILKYVVVRFHYDAQLQEDIKNIVCIVTCPRFRDQ
jgi:hypothetical protein